MDPLARRAVNLSVLRRHDKNIVEIMDSSSYVVVYKFDNETKSWTKKGVEGTLFVFKRCVRPVYGFIVMNRLGIDNFVASLTDSMDIEFTNTYIIYRTGQDDIHGIWVFEEKDRERIGKQMLACCELSKNAVPPPQLQESPPLPSTASISMPSYGKSIDLLTLFQQAGTKHAASVLPNGSTTPPSNNAPSEKDILSDLLRSSETRKVTAPVAPVTTPVYNHVAEGKSLLELLRQPTTTQTSTNSSVNQSNRVTVPSSSNPYLISTPPPQRPVQLPVERASHAKSAGNSPFLQSLLQTTPIHALVLPQNSSTQLKKSLPNNNSSAETNSAVSLTRKQAFDASIPSLPRFIDSSGGTTTTGILSRTEFSERFLHMIKSDPSFMDVLYDNYVINVQNNNAIIR